MLVLSFLIIVNFRLAFYLLIDNFYFNLFFACDKATHYSNDNNMFFFSQKRAITEGCLNSTPTLYISTTVTHSQQRIVNKTGNNCSPFQWKTQVGHHGTDLGEDISTTCQVHS